jgi:UDP-N-acetylglucosamine 4,6-dehydratase/5-epimerase
MLLNGTFTGSTLMITGGTGSFGSTMLRHFLHLPVKEIRIVSRDEKKQDDLRRHCADDRVKYHIADVRDARTIDLLCRGVDFIYHAAALKQVPSCEFHPSEAVATNVIGTANVVDGAIRNGVRKVICLSTDKAVYPVNAMGMSKALMEKVVASRSRMASDTGVVLAATRYGNVLASRGSVVPLFVEQVRAGKPITVTDPRMTRFVMTLDEAVELCLFAFEHGQSGDILVQKTAAVTIGNLAEAVLKVMKREDHEIRVIGARHGEKRHETLLTNEEMAAAEDCGRYYRIPCDNRDLNYDAYFTEGDERLLHSSDYNSQNARQLDVDEMAAMLEALPHLQRCLVRESAYEF